MSDINNKLLELQQSLDEINEWTSLVKSSQDNAADAIQEASRTIKDTSNLVKVFDTISNDLAKKNQSFVENRATVFNEHSDKINGIISTIQDEYKSVLEKLGNELKEVSNQIKTNNDENYKQLSDALKNDITAYDKQLKETLINFNQTSNQIKEDLTKSLSTYAELAKQTNKLVEYLRNVDFPSRLDKIDTAIAGTQQSLINLSDKTDRIKDSIINNSSSEFQKISTRVDEIAQNQLSQVDKLKEKTEQDLKNLSGKVNNVKEELIDKTNSNYENLDKLINTKNEVQQQQIENLSGNINSEIESLKIQITENQKTQKTLSIVTIVSIVITLILTIIILMK